jgi:hypothetical protein
MSKLEHLDYHSIYETAAKTMDPLERRLAIEHLELITLCQEEPGISCKLTNQGSLPPRDFRITFTDLPSIVCLDGDMLPVFGDTHVLEIHLPSGFPVEAPVCYMASEIWHPNIQSEEGPYQGRICGNTEGFGAYYSLQELVLRIRAMLRYEIYHAGLKFPYPEDENVARWVREYAEPLGIVRPGVGLIPNGAVPENWRSHIARETTKRFKVESQEKSVS